ncbi:winged helix-turn-helix transcriptional regulator [Rhodopseudomonas telluris]|uniref:Winged helix-turn-helix transcriptional regulator n=1 Tax=Rhodopseudomonas telluris TaxID=644215 RepID=A0ABV6EXH6_9BRAD
MRDDPPPLDSALRAIGDPWSFLIQQEAFFGVRRFGDFQRNLNIAKNTLTDRLSMLVEFGLLERKKLPDRSDIHEYRLTPRGLDTYQYALSLMRWGDDWVAGKDGPPVILSHKTCGRVLRPKAICSACKREIHAEDVQINLGNIAETIRNDTASVRVSSRPELYTAGRPTSVSRTLAVIGDRWGFFVLWLALAGISKFEHFHSVLGIARTTLTARLNHFVERGVLDRLEYQSRPPRYEYRLSESGKALCPVLLTLHDWGLRGLHKRAAKTSILHRSCGQPLHVEIVCMACGHPPLPKDVEVKQVHLVAPRARQSRPSKTVSKKGASRTKA